MTRIARLEGVKARVAPILYMEGACGVRLKADDDVSEIFKNGRASISLGYIGIHETINALYGNQHMYDSEALREKGVAIVQRLAVVHMLITVQRIDGLMDTDVTQ
ncbi:anaerobic ribonucleoside-triphosphate reductase [Klebsiella variicola]|uniref:anaerobic ribonucleoside-triphosphate reductase n=1 Tax=Klebsiella variicola TaxID=244366 RepID=UPI003C6D0454